MHLLDTNLKINCFSTAPTTTPTTTVPCPGDTIPSGDGNCVCPGNLIDYGNGNCSCPGNTFIDGVGHCSCPGDTINDGLGTCSCPENTMNDGDGNCLPTNGKEITLILRQANNIQLLTLSSEVKSIALNFFKVLSKNMA